MKKPFVDISICTMCMGCVELAPKVFTENDAGYIQVTELDEYPEDQVNEAIKYCPEDCIAWEDV